MVLILGGFCNSQNYWVDSITYKKTDKEIWSIKIVADCWNEECPYNAYIHSYEFIELITGDEFLRAIAKWIINEYWFCTNDTYNLTINQAFAIRNKKLEDFISVILK